MAKIGYEVEGRYKGLYTLFIDEKELNSLETRLYSSAKNVHQIYVSDLCGKLTVDQLQLLKTFKMISGCCTTLVNPTLKPFTHFG